MTPELSKPLTLIINQMITGIFPDSFKISNITPLFKKDDVSMLSNFTFTSNLKHC